MAHVGLGRREITRLVEFQTRAHMPFHEAHVALQRLLRVATSTALTGGSAFALAGGLGQHEIIAARLPRAGVLRSCGSRKSDDGSRCGRGQGQHAPRRDDAGSDRVSHFDKSLVDQLCRILTSRVRHVNIPD